MSASKASGAAMTAAGRSGPAQARTTSLNADVVAVRCPGPNRWGTGLCDRVILKVERPATVTLHLACPRCKNRWVTTVRAT